jgi:hypothetical protein
MANDLVDERGIAMTVHPARPRAHRLQGGFAGALDQNAEIPVRKPGMGDREFDDDLPPEQVQLYDPVEGMTLHPVTTRSAAHPNFALGSQCARGGIQL